MDRARRAALRALAVAPLLVARGGRAQATLAARPIPSSGEALPVIGLGTWQTFDVGADPAAREPLAEVLKLFAAGGGRVVDSSPMYGRAEAVVGALAAAARLHKRLFLATKVWTRGREEGERQIEQSFRRLRITQLDLLQVHNLNDTATHTRTFQSLKDAGRVRYTGITHYSPSAYGEMERLLKTRQYAFVQVNYSLAEPESGARLLPLAADLGVAVLINRPFAEGALFSRVRGKSLPSWAGELGIETWAQYLLKWIVGHPAVTCTIPGTAKPQHMLDNLAAGRGRLPDAAERARMAQYLERL